MDIRPEAEADRRQIHTLTAAAFRGRPYADGDEQDVIDRLRSCGALALSLVAVDSGEIVGQITFSPATVEDNSAPWFALGPVSVAPARQGEGIGAALIEAGLQRLRALAARGCILTGNPDYYRRFGFELAPDHVPAEEDAQYFMLKLLGGGSPRGRFCFHPAFYGPVRS